MLKKISELLSPAAVILDLKSKDKKGVIQELSAPLVSNGLIVEEAKFISAILRRENLESTGIGAGVAIPHARTDAVKTLVLAFGRSAAGVDFNSLDGKPSHLIFLICAPETMKREYIWTLAKISSLLRREEIRVGLINAKTVEEVYSVIERYEGN